METKAILRNYRVAPRKAREVVDLVRGKNVQDAQALLGFAVKRSAGPVLKLLKSAITSAKNNLKLEEKDLFVSRIFVDEGTRLKRWHPMSRGRAYPIEKRVSHITIILDELKNKRVTRKELRKAAKIKKRVSKKK